MRLIISFKGIGITITIMFENMDTITNNGDRLILTGGNINVVINSRNICNASALVIYKSWLIGASEVILDTWTEEVCNGEDS